MTTCMMALATPAHEVMHEPTPNSTRVALSVLQRKTAASPHRHSTSGTRNIPLARQVILKPPNEIGTQALA